MKKSCTSMPIRVFAFIITMILGIGSFSAFSQKDILLYATDFKDWTTLNFSSSSSNPFTLGSGAGAGFTVTEDASVDNTIGKYWIAGSTSGRELGIKPLTFISGGVIEIQYELTGGSSDRTYTIAGGTMTQGMIDAFSSATGGLNFANLVAGTQNLAGVPATTIDAAKLGIWYNGASNKILKTAVGTCTASFRITPLTGSQSLTIQGLRQDQPLRSLKVYTSVGATPYVAATNYPAAPAPGLSIAGSIGGPVVPGTVNVKAWNVGGSVTMSIVGTDAAKFSLPVTTLTNAQALAGQVVTVNFTPSVRTSVASAQLKLSTPGAPDYFVNIAGLTSSGPGAQIITPTTTVPFWTSLIAPVTSTVTIAGVNLTGAVTLSITGPDAGNFSIPVTTVSMSNASAGYPLTVTYTGDIQSGPQTANLVISSPGATNVTVPLSGLTMDSRPVTYDLQFVVSPSGSGYVDTNPAGTKFLDGTKVDVSTTPETGYSLDHWGDGKASNYPTRTITVNDLNKGTITVYFTTGVVIPPVLPGSAFVGYEPTGMTATSFVASWTTVPGATSYLVTAYNEDGSVKQTFPISSGATSSTIISGLTTNTFYSYKVETTGGVVPAQDTGVVGPFKTSGPLPVYNCPKVP